MVTNVTNMNIECSPKVTLKRLMYTEFKYLPIFRQLGNY